MNGVTLIDKLNQFDINACPHVFLDCFGNMGTHLWNKYEHYNRNMMELWSRLDLERRRELVSYIKKTY